MNSLNTKNVESWKSAFFFQNQISRKLWVMAENGLQMLIQYTKIYTEWLLNSDIICHVWNPWIWLEAYISWDELLSQKQLYYVIKYLLLNVLWIIYFYLMYIIYFSCYRVFYQRNRYVPCLWIFRILLLVRLNYFLFFVK